MGINFARAGVLLLVALLYAPAQVEAEPNCDASKGLVDGECLIRSEAMKAREAVRRMQEAARAEEQRERQLWRQRDPDNPVAGYYTSKPKNPPGFRQLCIKNKEPDQYHVELFTSYCPSKECMNARMDGLTFTSSLKNHRLTFSSPDCEIVITITKHGAEAKQRGRCDAAFYLDAQGKYNFIRTTLEEVDCSPRG